MNDDIDINAITHLIGDPATAASRLIPVLTAIQKALGYLPEAALRHLCQSTGIRPATVFGVATFYAQFRLRPAGRHTIKVCIGTACHVKGAESVFEAFRRHLNIGDDDDTDPDRLFTVTKVACLGCCMLAPAVQIDDLTYGFVRPASVPNVLRDFLSSASATAGPAARAHEPGEIEGEVRTCLCSSCLASGATRVADELKREVAVLALPAIVKTVGCTGMSYQTPLIEVAMRDGRVYHYGRVAPEDMRALLLRHFRPRRAPTRIRATVSHLLARLFTDEARQPITRYAVDVRDHENAAYVGRQHRIATERGGALHPLDLDEYRAHDGFVALRQCRESISEATLIDTISRSGLRGRGGAGYPTGAKWQAVRQAPSVPHTIICNGDEGDPGAFMDRMILESFPFRVIEGIAIAAHAVNAETGVIYIRAEYPLAMHRVRDALERCEAAGILGPKAAHPFHPLHMEVIEGAGAFVCGEETALIAAIEGRRGMPRFRPPYPSEQGLHGCPTLVNNVETFALVPWIVRHGAEAFAALGTEGSKGTKAFALAGKIRRGGLIEVPMGMTLREIVEELGGGIAEDKRFKAVQIGGPSGGCVPAEQADTPVDYESLAAAGAIMGSGGMVVLDESDCMVDIARYFLRFTQQESCGKCTFCRIGTKRMLEILDRLCQGEGRDGDIQHLEHLAGLVKNGSLCGLGRTAPNPVLSTIRCFRDEYEAHLHGRCPAAKCRALVTYTITDDCIGCTRCAQHCPVEAIPFNPYQKHEIDQAICTHCDTCRSVCPTGAVDVK